MSVIRKSTVAVVLLAVVTFGLSPQASAAESPFAMSEALRIGPGAIGVAVSPDGAAAYAISETSSRLMRIDTASGSVTRNIPVEIGDGRVPAGPRSVVVDEVTGAVIVAGQSRAAVLLYDPSTLNPLQEVVIPGFLGFSSAYVGRDGFLYLGTSPVGVGGSGQQGRIIKVDMDSGEIVLQSPDLGTSVLSLTVDSVNARVFFIGNSGTLQMWDMVSGEVKHSLSLNRGLDTSAVLSRDSSRLYVSGSDGVHVLDPNSLSPIDVWETVPNALAVALVEQLGVAYVVSDKFLNVVDLSTGTVIAKDTSLSITLGYGRYLATNGIGSAVAFVDGTSWVRTATLRGLPPSPPRGIKADVKGSGIVVSWRKPEYLGTDSPITYVVTTNSKSIGCRTRQTSCVLRNAQQGKNYRISVRASTGQFVGIATDPLRVRVAKPAPSTSNAPAVRPQKPSQAPS